MAHSHVIIAYILFPRSNESVCKHTQNIERFYQLPKTDKKLSIHPRHLSIF